MPALTDTLLNLYPVLRTLPQNELLAACHPEVPEPSLDYLVQEKDTTYFKLLWQKPISPQHSWFKQYSDKSCITPWGIVWHLYNRNPDSSLVCRDAATGAVRWVT